LNGIKNGHVLKDENGPYRICGIISDGYVRKFTDKRRFMLTNQCFLVLIPSTAGNRRADL